MKSIGSLCLFILIFLTHRKGDWSVALTLIYGKNRNGRLYACNFLGDNNRGYHTPIQKIDVWVAREPPIRVLTDD
jgi:hypothetical protein